MQRQLLISRVWWYVISFLSWIINITVVLQLLEDHLKALRAEEGVASDASNASLNDEAAWDGWDVEEDSSEGESDGWINVESDSEDLEISDSEDESDKKEKKNKKETKRKKGKNDDDDDDETEDAEKEKEPVRVSSLATAKVCNFYGIRHIPLGSLSDIDTYSRRLRSTQRAPNQGSVCICRAWWRQRREA